MPNRKTINTRMINYWNMARPLPATQFFKGMQYLTSKYNLVDNQSDPDYVFSICQQRFQIKGSYTKIFFAGEVIKPKMNKCDWAFAWEYEDRFDYPNYMRIPCYTRLYGGPNFIRKQVNVEAIMKQKTKFCTFISRSPRKMRFEFFKSLSKYKKIDAPGALCNNMPKLDTLPQIQKLNLPDGYKRKLAFLRPYKFTIAIENQSYDGYTSEKLPHGLMGNCATIYWGNPRVYKDFNPKSFINCHDEKLTTMKQQIEYMVERVIELDKDDDLYAKTLAEPWLPNNELTPWTNPKRIMKRFDKIFSKGKL